MRIDAGISGRSAPQPQDPQPDPVYHPTLLCRLCAAVVPNNAQVLTEHIARRCPAADVPLRVRARAALAEVRPC